MLSVIFYTAVITVYICGLVYFGWETGVLLRGKHGSERFHNIVTTIGWPVVFISRVYVEIRKLQGKEPYKSKSEAGKITGLIAALMAGGNATYAQGYTDVWDYVVDERWPVVIIGLLGVIIGVIWGVKQRKGGAYKWVDDRNSRGEVIGRKKVAVEPGWFGQKNIGFTIAAISLLCLAVFFIIAYSEV